MNKTTRESIINALSQHYICAKGVRIRELNYKDNPVAPENTAYRITFKQFGRSVKVTYWPNTVGFQE